MTSTGGAGVVVLTTAKRGSTVVASHFSCHEGEDRACLSARETAWSRALFQRLAKNQDASVFMDKVLIDRQINAQRLGFPGVPIYPSDLSLYKQRRRQSCVHLPPPTQNIAHHTFLPLYLIIPKFHTLATTT